MADSLSSFDEFAASLEPQPSHAQVLVEISTGSNALDRALDVLKSAGFSHLRYEILREELPQWVLIVLASRDMRSAVLKLIEAGFYHIKGINAKNTSGPSTNPDDEDGDNG